MNWNKLAKTNYNTWEFLYKDKDELNSYIFNSYTFSETKIIDEIKQVVDYFNSQYLLMPKINNVRLSYSPEDNSRRILTSIGSFQLPSTICFQDSKTRMSYIFNEFEKIKNIYYADKENDMNNTVNATYDVSTDAEQARICEEANRKKREAEEEKKRLLAEMEKKKEREKLNDQISDWAESLATVREKLRENGFSEEMIGDLIKILVQNQKGKF